MRYATAAVGAVLLTVGQAGAMERIDGQELTSIRGQQNPCQVVPGEAETGHKCEQYQPKCWPEDWGDCQLRAYTRIFDSASGETRIRYIYFSTGGSCPLHTSGDCGIDYPEKYLKHFNQKYGKCVEGTQFDSCDIEGVAICVIIEGHSDADCDDETPQLIVGLTCGCPLESGGTGGLTAIQPSY